MKVTRNKMSMWNTCQQQYIDLMWVMRSRFDAIEMLLNKEPDGFNRGEIMALHGRKIIEGIAFACLIALNNGWLSVPKSAEEGYSAGKILNILNGVDLNILPSPNISRVATEDERSEHGVRLVLDGAPDRRLTKDELVQKYNRMHEWLHELNPYTKLWQIDFHKKNKEQLSKDIEELKLFLVSHVISINGKAFFCTLRDTVDGQIKVISCSK